MRAIICCLMGCALFMLSVTLLEIPGYDWAFYLVLGVICFGAGMYYVPKKSELKEQEKESDL